MRQSIPSMATSGALKIPPLGSFVKSQERPELGLGKVLEITRENAHVEYFVSSAERILDLLPISSLVRVRLENQTRCYYETDEGFKAGRIEMWDKDHYWVRSPNNVREFLPEADLYIRCNKRIEDPTEILVEKTIETPFFFQHRQAFVRSQVEQRAASQGLSALLSAGIRLYPHQVEVIRRVLEDPIQRYLLADEVGLGKTIEAGVLLRQFLIDEPEGRILIVVPSHLQEQWIRELDGKLGLLDFETPYQLITPDEILTHDYDKEYVALVIDEAHHLASGAFSSDKKLNRQFQRLRMLAKKTPRVLLLSATPVLHNEQDYLAMLHLLDPDSYPLDDIEGFKQRIAARQSIGKLLLNLKEKSHPAPLKMALQRVEKAFPEDAYVQRSVSKILEVIQDEAVRIPLVRALRVHLSETYRLHRRMLRNRRDSVEEVLNHRGTFTAEYDLDDQVGEIVSLIEEWRAALQHALQEHHPGDRTDWQTLYLLLVTAAGSWLGLLDALIETRLGKPAPAWLVRDLSPTELVTLTKLPLFPEEADWLRGMQKMMRSFSDGEGDRIELLRELLLHHFSVRFGQGNARVVVFTGFQKVAEEIYQGLAKAFGTKGIAKHLRDYNAEARDAELKRFQKDPTCWLFICDVSGEEGLNLQDADAIIHFDLPFHPNRVEQRMGRLDRLGRRKDLKTWALAGSEHELSLQECWIEILQNGFGVFNQSIAGLQFLIDEHLPHLLTTAFEQGATGLRNEAEQLREAIEIELERIAEQQAIDEIDVREQGATFAFDRLKSMDDSWEKHSKALQGLAENVLQFRSVKAREGGFFYRYLDRTLVPSGQFLPFCQSQEFSPAVFSREEVTNHAGVRVYRMGHPFVDSLADYLQWDDRGKVFAMWRSDDRWPATDDPWVGFYFSFLVEADLKVAQTSMLKAWGDLADLRALRRRADALFSPLFFTIAINALTGEECAPLVKEILQKPWGKESSLNLGSRLRYLDDFIGPSQWPEVCRQVRTSAEQSLRAREDLNSHISKSLQLTNAHYERRLAQLKQRQLRGTEGGDIRLQEALKREITYEELLLNALIQGIQKPCIRLDSIGFAAISQMLPPSET